MMAIFGTGRSERAAGGWPAAEREPALVDPLPGDEHDERFEYISGTVDMRRFETEVNEYGQYGWKMLICIRNVTPSGYWDGTVFVILERTLR